MEKTQQVQEMFETVRKCVGIFTVASAVVLAVVVANAVTHGGVSTFMWVRSVIVLAAAVLLQRFALRAARGERSSFDRLRTVATVLPIALIVVDLIPGMCPVWYAVLQGVSAVPLIAVAVITRRRVLSAAFAGENGAR